MRKEEETYTISSQKTSLYKMEKNNNEMMFNKNSQKTGVRRQ